MLLPPADFEVAQYQAPEERIIVALFEGIFPEHLHLVAFSES